MPEPQPEADRPVDGNTPHPHGHGEQAVTEEHASAVPPADSPGPEGTRELPARAMDAGPSGTRKLDAEAIDVGPAGTRKLDAEAMDVGPAGTRKFSAEAVDTGPAGTAGPAGIGPAGIGPAGTRRLDADEAEAAEAARFSGSAAVPPPPARRRSWGESAEPTPVPSTPPQQPEHQVPVDPWAGVDTGGWELPSADFPAMPPPPPAPTRPYPMPPVSPAPARPPAVRPTSPPPSPAAYPVPPSPPVARPVSPPPPPAARSVSPPAYPPHQAPQVALPRVKQRRGSTPRPAPPPPGGQAPPAVRRKRRRWPWMLLLTIACCCGCPAYYGTPMFNQYPVDAALPAQVDDLRLREDARSAAAVRKLKSEVRQAHWLAEDTFAGIYTTPAGKRVTVFGGTGIRLTPESDAEAEIKRLSGQYALRDIQVVDTNVRGRHERCAVGRADGTGVVVCTSVDHGSITSAVFTGLSVDDSARLLGTLRQQIVTTNSQ